VSAVVYLQNRTHRAGAQTCLARILSHADGLGLKPALVCSQPGWLTGECERFSVPVIREPFPSSRSISARLFGNARFARGVSEKLPASIGEVAIVHANDHLEGLLGLHLAKELQARSAIFLRSPGMTERDYFKYRCNEYDLIVAVGDELQARAQAWDPSRKIELIHDGIDVDEFAPPKQKPARPPDRVLVIGSPLDWKGWADLTEALYLLEQTNTLPSLWFDFTGDLPDPKRNDLKLARLRSIRCSFLGRVEAFRDLVRGYDLVVNPTRMESFGMAAIEIVAAGVPLLSSRTGVIEQVLRESAVLFRPAEPKELASAIANIITRWNKINFRLEDAQQEIRRRFLIAGTVARLRAAYGRQLAMNSV
jgi:glycosyltransferase involved in cell wall biosynthesis